MHGASWRLSLEMKIVGMWKLEVKVSAAAFQDSGGGAATLSLARDCVPLLHGS